MINVHVGIVPERGWPAALHIPAGDLVAQFSKYPGVEGDVFLLFCQGLCDLFEQPLDAQLYDLHPNGKSNWQRIVISKEWFSDALTAATSLGGYLGMWDRGGVRFEVRYGTSVRRLRGVAHGLSALQ